MSQRFPGCRVVAAAVCALVGVVSLAFSLPVAPASGRLLLIAGGVLCIEVAALLGGPVLCSRWRAVEWWPSASALRWLVCATFTAQQTILYVCIACMSTRTLAVRLSLLFLLLDIPAVSLEGLQALARDGTHTVAERVFLTLASLSSTGKFGLLWATIHCHARAGAVGSTALQVGLSLTGIYTLGVGLARACDGWQGEVQGGHTYVAARNHPTLWSLVVRLCTREETGLVALQLLDVLAMCASTVTASCDARVPPNVQFLWVLFSTVGYLTVGLYSAYLFFTDTARETAPPLGPPFASAEGELLAFASGAAPATQQDAERRDAAVHFFAWTLLLVDLPYLSLRLVAAAVRGEPPSPFLLKNGVVLLEGLLLLTKPPR